jgi:dienelactone hydrolase
MLAWTMYSRIVEFRVDLVAFDGAGRAHLRNPSILADRMPADLASLLAGSDHWREAVSVGALRDHLGDLADYACRDLHAASVLVTIHERRGGHYDQATACERRCAP